MIFNLNDSSVGRLVEIALQEDIGTGDVTSEAVISHNAYTNASFLAKQDGIICGLPIAELVFKRLQDGEVGSYEDELSNITWTPLVAEGSFVTAGTVIASVEGTTQLLLQGERTALNFLQRMSGVASLTQRYTQALEGTNTHVCDTRKTIPAWRLLDKYAVKTGGGVNHRIGLYDMVMIKDNHRDAAGSITEALRCCNEALANRPSVPIEVETRTLEDVKEVLDCLESGLRVERIMFDNFTPFNVRKGVAAVERRLETEASGGITLASIRQYAETGVDFISIGALTHSAPALDISMKFLL